MHNWDACDENELRKNAKGEGVSPTQLLAAKFETGLGAFGLVRMVEPNPDDPSDASDVDICVAFGRGAPRDGVCQNLAFGKAPSILPDHGAGVSFKYTGGFLG